MEPSALERCLRKLVALGQQHDGFITYTQILDILDRETAELSIEDVEAIYQRLTQFNIEIVDELPKGHGISYESEG